MSGKPFNVYSINSVVPIKYTEQSPPSSYRQQQYHQETVECQRYEQGLCRVCLEPRKEYSPWCEDHFPWAPHDIVELPVQD